MNSKKNMTTNSINLKAELDKRNIEIVAYANGANVDNEIYSFDVLVKRQNEGLTGVIMKLANDDIISEEFNKVLNNPDNAEKIMSFLNDESFVEDKDLDDVTCTFECKRKGIAQCICLDETYELEDFTVKLSRRDPKTDEMSKEKIILTMQGIVVPREVYKYLDSFDDSIHKSVLICTIADYIEAPDRYDFEGLLELEDKDSNNYKYLDANMQAAEIALKHYKRLEILAESESTLRNTADRYGMLWISAKRIADIYMAQDEKYIDICNMRTEKMFENQCVNAIKYYCNKEDRYDITDDDMQELTSLLFSLANFGYSNKDIWALTGLLVSEGVNKRNVREFIYPIFKYMRPILEESVFDEAQDEFYEPEDAYGALSLLLALLPIAPEIISKEIEEFFKFGTLTMSEGFFNSLTKMVDNNPYAHDFFEDENF